MINRPTYEANQARLLSELNDYLTRQGSQPNADQALAARQLAGAMFLSHATSQAGFQAMAAGDQTLLSPQELHARGLRPLDPGKAEVTLGTQAFVFFFSGPFSYPNACGFLFKPSLENDHRDLGSASPFDSGGLARHMIRPDPTEHCASFLRRHELPLPEHREYLAASMAGIFRSPEDYLSDIHPKLPGPIGLRHPIGTALDRRVWTHEVRIPDRVPLRNACLEAVFVPASLSADPHIRNLLAWCETEGYAVERIENGSAGEFDSLKRACEDYLLRKLMP